MATWTNTSDTTSTTQSSDYLSATSADWVNYTERPSCADIPDFFFIMAERIALYKRDWLENQIFQNHLFRILIATIFNIYAAKFYNRQIFSKSGFVGRVGKRLKGK